MKQDLLLTRLLCHPARRRCRRRASGCGTCTRPRTTRAATTARRAWCTSGEAPLLHAHDSVIRLRSLFMALW